MQGAATTCYVALSPQIKDVSGKYFADCNEASPSKEGEDEVLGKRLWEFCQQILKKSKAEK